MTETQVRDKLREYGLLNMYRINTADFTARLNKHDIDFEQYLTYFLTEVGASANIASADSINRYTEARTLEESTLLKHIYNAYLTFSKLNDNLKDEKMAMDCLKEMVEPHLLYFMYSAADLPLEASKYKEAAVRYASTFKSAIDKLPEEFNMCKEALSGST